MASTICPNHEAHTPCPIQEYDYLGMDRWHKQMAKTHNQKKCPDCGLWKVWVPKKRRDFSKLKKSLPKGTLYF